MSEDGLIYEYNYRELQGHSDKVSSVRISVDNKIIISGSCDGSI